MKLSARNQFRGRVTAVDLGAVMAQITVEIEPSTANATITRASAEELGLTAGDEVTVVVKSTEVMIGKE